VSAATRTRVGAAILRIELRAVIALLAVLIDDSLSLYALKALKPRAALPVICEAGRR
jgi:hypothetical protein